MKYYKCKIENCLFEAITYDMALEHAQQEHPEELSAKGQEALISIENIDNQEIIDILTEANPEEFKKKTYAYPKHPYYSDGKKLYGCTECNFESDIEGFWKHVLGTHPSDGREVLTHYFSQQIIKDHLGKTKTEPLTKEQVTKWAEQMYQNLMINLEAQPDGVDILAKFIDNTSTPEQKKMVQGLRQSCNYCGAVSLNVPDLQEQYWQEKILTELRRTNPHLKKTPFNDLVKVKFKGMWNLEPIELDLPAMMHYATKHPEKLQQLVCDRTLKGDLAMWLASIRCEPSKQQLTFIALTPAVERLGSEIKTYLKWLDGKRKQ